MPACTMDSVRVSIELVASSRIINWRTAKPPHARWKAAGTAPRQTVPPSPSMTVS